MYEKLIFHTMMLLKGVELVEGIGCAMAIFYDWLERKVAVTCKVGHTLALWNFVPTPKSSS